MLDKLKKHLLEKEEEVIEELISQWEFELEIGENTSEKIRIAKEVLKEKRNLILKI